jgi:acetylornithine deacetylase/succinyl-diaminopimelate desuccinylase-like protein
MPIARTPLFVSCILLFLAPTLPAQVDDATKQLSHDIFKELIEINTTDSVGNNTLAAEAMAKRLLDAGFAQEDVAVLGPNDRKKNLVVRLRGNGAKKPVLLIGHLDVVEAKPEDWTTDPFKFVEKDGFFYGRGTQDMKNGDAIMVTTLIRLKKENYKPDRDIILALTADEEGGLSNGVDWLLKNKRDLVDAEFVLNHDTSINSDHGKVTSVNVTATEKLYADYQLEVTNPGGHSSLPKPENAIYRLAAGLQRLSRYQFPFELNSVTRAYYESLSKLEKGQKAADMKAILRKPPSQAAIARLSQDAIDNSTMRTTCVATRLNAGHANNALPQRAQANVNCRIFPGHTSEEIRLQLVKVLADPKISVRWLDPNRNPQEHGSDRQAYPAPKLLPEVFQPLQRTVDVMWPGAPVVPEMSTGATDAVYTNAAGLPTYAIGGTPIDRDDIRAHGRDERIAVESFYQGVDFYYRFLKAVTVPATQ